MKRLINLLLLTIVCASASAEEPQSDAQHWYSPAQSDLIYLQTPHGQTVIALLPFMAPKHSEHLRKLVASRMLDKHYFYRVIDGFVAQGGTQGEPNDNPLTQPLAAEVLSAQTEQFVSVQAPGFFAPQEGFINGVSAAYDPSRKQVWLTHCPGAVAMARGNEPSSAATEFYVVIGQAPHHLDRNMTIVGKVLSGMQYLQQLPRGDVNQGGVIAEPGANSQILSVRMGNELEGSAQRHFRIQQASHPDYQKRVNAAKVLEHPFYFDKQLTPRPIDTCYYQPKVEEIVSTDSSAQP